MRRLDAGGEALLPIRATARLPISAPVGRFVLSGYCDVAKPLLGSRTKSAEGFNHKEHKEHKDLLMLFTLSTLPILHNLSPSVFVFAPLDEKAR